ncbi:hypothetical protein EDC05_004893 [Coemansia umbellata]|nr:hypothetical protein EDC05_004893 [Coemansia umbellata]
MPSGQMRNSGSHTTRSHQRTTSASSLTSATLASITEGPSSPIAKRTGRFASALRSGLRKNSVLHTGLWPSSRARAATHAAQEYILPTPPTVSSPSVRCSSGVLSENSLESPTTLSSPSCCSGSNGTDADAGVGADAGNGNGSLPYLSLSCTLPSPPPTASTNASHHLSGASTIPLYSLTVSACTSDNQPPYSLHESDGNGATPAPGTFRPRKRSLSVGGENACRDFFARQIEQYGLQSLLTSPVAACYFMASTISSYSPETLLFYLEAEHYRTANFASEDRRIRYAKGLYKAFISHRAPLEINISHGMRQHIMQALRVDGAVTTSMFKETQDHAYALLEQDYYLFRQRPLFHRMMAELSASPTAGSSSSRKETRSQHLRAVSAVYDALSKTYGVHTLPASKSKLVESEIPTFTKFADMDLTSTDLKTTLPAWLCRTTMRLIDTPMPTSFDELCKLQRCGGETSAQANYTRPTTTACSAHQGSASSQATKLQTSSSQSPSQLSLVILSPAMPVQNERSQKTEDQVQSISEPKANIESAGACAGNASVKVKSTKKANKQKSLQRMRFRFQTEPESAGRQTSGSELRKGQMPTKSRWESLWSTRRRKAT